MFYTKVEGKLRQNAGLLTRGSALKAQIKNVFFDDLLEEYPFTARLPDGNTESFVIAIEDEIPSGRKGRQCTLYNDMGKRIASLPGLSEYTIRGQRNSGILQRCMHQIASPNRYRMWTRSEYGNGFAITSELLRQELFSGLIIDNVYEYFNNDPFLTLPVGKCGMELGIVWGILANEFHTNGLPLNTGDLYDLLESRLNTVRMSDIYDDITISFVRTEIHREWIFRFKDKTSNFSFIEPVTK